VTDLFDFKSPRALYAVMGNPVAHSRSPQIHELFAAQFGLRIEYQRILVEPGGFVQAIEGFRANGGRGLNITLPFKQEAWRACDRCSERADIAEAVNTMTFEDSVTAGDNTDGAGLVSDITGNLATPLKARRVLIIGAGGAVRGVLGPVLAADPELTVVANRTVDRAVELAQRFASLGTVQGTGFSGLKGRQFDVVINGTSASLQGEVPPVPVTVFAPGALAYDMMYADRATVFMRWAQEHGAARVRDGFGMLVEQAAESFRIWHGRRPETAPVIRALAPAAVA